MAFSDLAIPYLIALTIIIIFHVLGKMTDLFLMDLTGGSGIYNFAWTGPAGANLNNALGRSQTGLIAGIYGVIVTDLNGCTKNV